MTGGLDVERHEGGEMTLAGRVRRGVLVAAGIAVVLVALNVAGYVRYPGGPLRDSIDSGPLWLDLGPGIQGSDSYGNTPADWAHAGAMLFFDGLVLHNGGPWPATVEAVTPVDPSDGLAVQAVYVARPTTMVSSQMGWGPAPLLPEGLTLDQAYASPPVVVEPSGRSPAHDVGVLLVISGSHAGPAGFSALAVDYRVGPFAFRAIQHVALVACLGPLPAGVTCPNP